MIGAGAPDPRGYAFREVGHGDLELVRGWLCERHVRRYWGDPAEQLAIIERCLVHAEGVRSLIVSLPCSGGEPFAYVQVWPAHPDSDHLDQPEGTVGIDLLIGPSAMLGRGHGSGLLRALVPQLFAQGASRIIIDPAPDNQAAIGAYAKAGFRRLGIVNRRDGPVVLMARDPGQTEG